MLGSVDSWFRAHPAGCFEDLITGVVMVQDLAEMTPLPHSAARLV